MADKQVAMISLWQNDSARGLHARAMQLLWKVGKLRWIWVVGDSDDSTEDELLAIAARHSTLNITVLRHDTGIVGEDAPTRLRRLGATVNAAFDTVRDTDDYVILHESDLRSPPNLVRRFTDSGHCPIAGWVTLGEGGIFYDTFAYRKDGTWFTNLAPYHACYRPDAPFEVDCFGSCWMCHAEDIRGGVRCGEWAVIDICEQLKARGRSLWVDPRIPIVQPVEYWIPRQHA